MVQDIFAGQLALNVFLIVDGGETAAALRRGLLTQAQPPWLQKPELSACLHASASQRLARLTRAPQKFWPGARLPISAGLVLAATVQLLLLCPFLQA